MKTAKEIRKFIKSREWYRYWKTFILCTDLSLFKKLFVLTGHEPQQLFFYFDWSKTLQNSEYWAAAADEFNRWYEDGQE